VSLQAGLEGYLSESCLRELWACR